jgi:hypothetical protein
MNTCEKLIEDLCKVQRFAPDSYFMKADDRARFVKLDEVLTVVGTHIARIADEKAE